VSRRSLQLTAALGAAAVVVIGVGGTSGLLAAVPVAWGAWFAAGRLHERPARGRPDPAMPLVLDLIAAAVRAGQPVSAALLLAAPIAEERSAGAIVRVARLLALGADPAEAWAPLEADPALRDVARAARRSATSGIRLAAAFEQTAVDLRAARRATAQAQASRAGAFATLPLGLCFLPAFVCLAIVPVIVGIAATALGAAR
jgi:pilus assembly protein TadC